MTAPAHVAHAGDLSSVALECLRRERISALPVVDSDGVLVGFLSTTDILRAPTAHGDVTVGSLMSAPAVVAHPGEALDEAAWRMVAARVHRLVVVENEVPIGILSTRDLLQDVERSHLIGGLGSIMTSEVRTVMVDDTIEAAVMQLREAGVHGLVVLDGANPVGVFTQAEALAARFFPQILREDRVDAIMSHETICLDVSTTIHRAAAQAIAMDVRRVLVTEKRQLVGIVSSLDLVGAFASAPEHIVASAG